jgi:hypothetical protein
MRRVDFVERFSATLGSLSSVMAFPGLTPPRDLPKDFGVFPEHSEDGLHALLNGTLRWIPIALTWKCCSDLVNLCLQHLIKAQLILCSHREVVHLGTYDFQELVSGMNLLTKFIIYPQLISDDIPEWGSFLLKFCPLPPCWRLLNGKQGLFHTELKP